MFILILDKVELSLKVLNWKMSNIYKIYIVVVNLYVLNKIVIKYIWIKLLEMWGEIDENKIIVGNFDSFFLKLDRVSLF